MRMTRSLRLGAEFQRQADQGRRQDEHGDSGTPRAERDRGAEQPGRREHRVAVGDEQGDDGEAGERRQGLARRRDRGDDCQPGEDPRQRAGDERNAEGTAAGGVERGEEMARPPQAEAAEEKRAGLQPERLPTARVAAPRRRLPSRARAGAR